MPKDKREGEGEWLRFKRFSWTLKKYAEEIELHYQTDGFCTAYDGDPKWLLTIRDDAKLVEQVGKKIQERAEIYLAEDED